MDNRKKWKHEPREDSRTLAHVFVGLQAANGHPSSFWDSVSYTVTRPFITRSPKAE